MSIRLYCKKCVTWVYRWHACEVVCDMINVMFEIYFDTTLIITHIPIIMLLM